MALAFAFAVSFTESKYVYIEVSLFPSKQLYQQWNRSKNRHNTGNRNITNTDNTGKNDYLTYLDRNIRNSSSFPQKNGATWKRRFLFPSDFQWTRNCLHMNWCRRNPNIQSDPLYLITIGCNHPLYQIYLYPLVNIQKYIHWLGGY